MSIWLANSTDKVQHRRPLAEIQPGIHALPRVLGTASSDIFVVNKDAKTLAPSSHYDDPQEHVLTDSTNQNRAIVLTNPSASYLDLFQIISHTAAATITTSLKVRAHGFFPYSDKTSRFDPFDIDSTNFDDPLGATYTSTTFEPRGGIWVPLFNPVVGLHELDFGTSIQITKHDTTASAKVQHIVGGATLSYYTAGAKRIVVLVSQATVLSGGTSMVLGKWTM